MDSSGLGQGPVVSCSEEGNDTLETIKGRRIINWDMLAASQEDSAP
jgi:hypothetical protein